METAQGIISVVTANMAKAIRVISVQRGHDPRDYTLTAFGGAGPLHAALSVLGLSAEGQRFAPASLTRITMEDGRPRLISLSDVRHLDSPS